MPPRAFSSAARALGVPASSISRRIADLEAELAKPLPVAGPRKVLTADEQRLLRRLSIFAGDFSLEAAEAVCDAAVRGVKVKLLVSHWNTEAPAIAYLKSLAILPNVEIRVVTLPRAAAGFIRGQLGKNHSRTVVTEVPEAEERPALELQVVSHVDAAAELPLAARGGDRLGECDRPRRAVCVAPPHRRTQRRPHEHLE